MQHHLSCSFPSNLPGILFKKLCIPLSLWVYSTLKWLPLPGSQGEHKLDLTKPLLEAQNSSFVFLQYSWISDLVIISQKQKFQIYLWEDFSWPTKSRRYRKLYKKCPCSCHHIFQAGKWEEILRKLSCFSEEIFLSLMHENDTINSFTCKFCSEHYKGVLWHFYGLF